jgi:UPF0755 protein
MRRSLIWAINVAILAGSALLIVWGSLTGFLHSPMSAEHAQFEYVVEPGASIRHIGSQLHARGVLREPFYWELYARLTGVATRIKAGEYRIHPYHSPAQLLEQLTNGRVVQYSFTLIEGWTFEQLRAALASHPVLVATLQDATPEQIMTAVGAAGEHPEGRFLPDTYFFPRGTTDVAFLQRAYRSMQDKLASEWAGRAGELPLKTPYEALTLASIVERETAVPDERATIAGVFIERLRRKMYLQTDPTVIYGMGDRYKGRIRYNDLRRDTPYNTYTRKGLTPTPIAMPSAEAIHAALHPEYSGALYFVARGDGTHQFSASLREHNEAVIKYQLNGDASRLRGNR